MISSAEEFVSLRQSERPEQYFRSANESAAAEVWGDVIERFPEMRIWVAHNKTVPMEILTLLARDHDPTVRAAVAMKNKLSRELFVVLASDPDESVRVRMAFNKNVPADLLARLADDSSGVVSVAALDRLRGSRSGR